MCTCVIAGAPDCACRSQRKMLYVHLNPFRHYMWLSLDLDCWPESTSKCTALGLQMCCPHLAFDLGSFLLRKYSYSFLKLSTYLLVIGQLVASFLFDLKSIVDLFAFWFETYPGEEIFTITMLILPSFLYQLLFFIPTSIKCITY